MEEIEREDVVESETDDSASVAGNPPAEEPRTFTQEQVNAIAGRAREEGRRRGYEDAVSEIVSRYGLDGEDELDDIYGKGSRFDELTERYGARDAELKEAKTELALVKAGIEPSRYGDVKAILSSKGMDVCDESIASEGATHPEWFGAKIRESEEASESIGTIPSPADRETDEDVQRKEAERLFGMNFR